MSNTKGGIVVKLVTKYNKIRDMIMETGFLGYDGNIS